MGHGPCLGGRRTHLCKGTGSGKCPCVMKELLKLQPWLGNWEKGKQAPPSKRGIFLRWATEATPCTGITRLKLSQKVGQGDPF